MVNRKNEPHRHTLLFGMERRITNPLIIEFGIANSEQQSTDFSYLQFLCNRLQTMLLTRKMMNVAFIFSTVKKPSVSSLLFCTFAAYKK